jgi:hypothetical protein
MKQLGRCAISGCLLSITKLLFSTMSLDAIIAGQPHSADNIQWVCVRLNLGKWLWSDSVFRVWAKAAFTWSGRPSSLQDICTSLHDAGGDGDDEADE